VLFSHNHLLHGIPASQSIGCDPLTCCVHRKYIDADFLPASGGMYDFISVDGRARVHCLKRALPLLKPEGGILMLVCTRFCTLATSWHASPVVTNVQGHVHDAVLHGLQDNSEREWYADAFAAVPDHWLKFEDLVNTGNFCPVSSAQVPCGCTYITTQSIAIEIALSCPSYGAQESAQQSGSAACQADVAWPQKIRLTKQPAN
jgi:hypothetical protein